MKHLRSMVQQRKDHTRIAVAAIHAAYLIYRHFEDDPANDPFLIKNPRAYLQMTFDVLETRVRNYKSKKKAIRYAQFLEAVAGSLLRSKRTTLRRRFYRKVFARSRLYPLDLNPVDLPRFIMAGRNSNKQRLEGYVDFLEAALAGHTCRAWFKGTLRHYRSHFFLSAAFETLRAIGLAP